LIEDLMLSVKEGTITPKLLALFEAQPVDHR